MIEKLLSIKHWHLAEHFMNSVGAMAIKRMEMGKDLSPLITAPQERMLSGNYQMVGNNQSNLRVVETSNGDKVALIPLYGTMTKWGGMCSYGTVELAQMIDEANKNQEISAIVIDTDSPGGSSDSIEVMERAIGRSEKPIVGYVNDMAASAALWTMSAVAKNGKVIVDSLQNSSMGSIGTLMIYRNMMAYYKEKGLEVEIIRAPQSVDKAKPNSIEPLTQELRAEIQQELKDLTDTFIGAVKNNYGSRLMIDTPRLFTGGMFDGQQSIAIGLAHDQGEFTQAVDLALDMAATQKKNSFLTINNNQMKFPNLSKLFSSSEKEANNEGLTPEQEQAAMEAAESKLAEMESENAQLKEQNGTLANEVVELKASKEAMATSLTEKDAKIAELQAKLDETPAAPATTAVAQEEQHGGEGEKAKYETSADKELAEYKSNVNNN